MPTAARRRRHTACLVERGYRAILADASATPDQKLRAADGLSRIQGRKDRAKAKAAEAAYGEDGRRSQKPGKGFINRGHEMAMAERMLETGQRYHLTPSDAAMTAARMVAGQITRSDADPTVAAYLAEHDGLMAELKKRGLS